MMPATLRLTREGVGIELRRGLFEVMVDGKGIGSLRYQETFEAPLQPGHHTLRIRAGRYSSRDQSFDATEDGTVSFRCHGAMVWPRWAASFVKPDLGISLKRQ
jgi:hypothetical protein